MRTDEIQDRSTTPKSYQLPLALGWYALFIFFMGCFHFSMSNERPSWSYFGAFHMFTTKSNTNYHLAGEAFVNGRWETIDLEAMYPTRWESGYRYQRGPFRRSGKRMRTLAASTCKRHGGKPEGVRFIQTSWKRQLGTTEHPVVDPKKKVLLSWRCGTPWKLPGGRSL